MADGCPDTNCGSALAVIFRPVVKTEPAPWWYRLMGGGPLRGRRVGWVKMCALCATQYVETEEGSRAIKPRRVEDQIRREMLAEQGAGEGRKREDNKFPFQRGERVAR